MTIAFPGYSMPAGSFDVPLEMLAACHRRVERQCATLRHLVPHLAAHGADSQAREAAQAVIRYFDTAARDHHADEEEDLFPALLEVAAESDAGRVREMTGVLCAEHVELGRHWDAIRRQLEGVLRGESSMSADGVAAFAALYERHISFEESQLLPLACRLLGKNHLERIGSAMLRRRRLSASGVADPRPPG